ncbi:MULTISPECIES: OmpH family outer membrane protein [Galbibacter]|uniref:OmpH family outer membrane protein n=1 Tax=Galbibacter pacificus TaxID=2996052 RepID=A0ABT6FTA3_9FLAO|nr:OmpH family outer membrane protein [Galbibacter pacificus]MDG3582402.1 OmpH family outer membrane protein [Galbibacter pacificus]MDG3586480.1 OmpH family outer membrane protein [Galbibacter pacificus]
MKQFKKLVIAVVLVVGSVSFANAQSKIAHIDVQKLVEDMPAMKAAQAELQKLGENYQADIKTSYQELQNKMTLYKNEAGTKSQEENQKRAQEVDGMQQSIMQAQQQAQQELSKKERELLQPILQKANDAIQKVGRAQGFDYVLDSSTGSGVILADGKDLLADVKKELGF